jgi:hypothetical protein
MINLSINHFINQSINQNNEVIVGVMLMNRGLNSTHSFSYKLRLPTV